MTRMHRLISALSLGLLPILRLDANFAGMNMCCNSTCSNLPVHTDVNCSGCCLTDDDLSRISFSNESERIDLSYNRLFILNASTFCGLPFLQTLNVSSNYFIRIERGAFSKLSSLRILDISHNNDLGLENFFNLTYGLNNTEIEELYANYIVSVTMPGIIVSKNITQNLQNTSLKSRSFDANQFQYVEIETVLFLPESLVNLSVRANVFGGNNFVVFLVLLDHLPNLQKIDFSYQCTSYREFEYRVRHKRVIDNSKSRDGQETIGQMCYYETLFELKDISLSSSLKTIVAEGTEITGCIPAIQFRENSIRDLHFSKSDLYAWIGPITINETSNLSFVDLSDNNCKTVSDHFFDYGFTIDTLLLSGNNLGPVFASIGNNRLFRNLTKLRILDLSRNSIEELDEAFLKDQTRLESLSFSQNYLRVFRISLLHMRKLKHLDLSHNRITVICETLRRNLDNIFSVLRQNVTFNISVNPLECTCNGTLFWLWAQQTEVRVLYDTSTKCTMENGTDIAVSLLLHDLNQVVKSCKSKLLFIIAMTILILTIVTFCAILIYRYRWEIRYRWYLYNVKRKGYQRIADSEGDFFYDVFLSYAEEDKQYVHRNILPYLESGNDLRVCLHQRDFTPGESIASNIIRAVHGSHRTLAIITPKYIESHWCMYEFRMASMEQAFGNRKVIIVALLRNLTVSNIPPELMHYLRTNSYIELPREGSDIASHHAWSALLTSITT